MVGIRLAAKAVIAHWEGLDSPLIGRRHLVRRHIIPDPLFHGRIPLAVATWQVADDSIVPLHLGVWRVAPMEREWPVLLTEFEV